MTEEPLISLSWKKTWGEFQAGQRLELVGPICTVVGECGSGKSSLLRMIARPDPTFAAVQFHPAARKPIFLHDFELDSPRLKPLSGKSPDEMAVCLAAARMSHGQSNIKLLKEIEHASNCLILLDEPESGLSPSICAGLACTIRAATMRGCSFVIATHSPIIALVAPFLLDLSRMRRIIATEWLRETCGFLLSEK